MILVENRDFFTLHLHSTPTLGGPRRNIAIMFVIEKLERCGYQTVKSLRICLFILLQCTNVTDGRTPHDSKGRACSLAGLQSRGKYFEIGQVCHVVRSVAVNPRNLLHIEKVVLCTSNLVPRLIGCGATRRVLADTQDNHSYCKISYVGKARAQYRSMVLHSS